MQELVHNRRVVERHRLLGLALLVIVDHVAVVILDAVDRVRLVILAAVAEHLIGRGHFADADALVEAAERNAAEVVASFSVSDEICSFSVKNWKLTIGVIWLTSCTTGAFSDSVSARSIHHPVTASR